MRIIDWLLLVLVVILGAALAIVSRHFFRYRRKRREEGGGRPWVLPRIPVCKLDDAFIPDQFLGYTRATEVAFIALGPFHVVGVTSDFEAWILAVLSRNAKKMFEFGTCTGRTAYLWARNSPPDALVYTITLHPAKTSVYQEGTGDRSGDKHEALIESTFDRFMYTGTDVAHKVVQYFGDSKEFDETQFVGSCDLIFIDGSHAHSYVLSDSEKALRMIRQGGIILWHDYRGPNRLSGVYDTLNELGRRIPLYSIEGTTLVAYRAPTDSQVS